MLLAEVAGTPPFEITWFKDNTTLRSGRKHKTFIQDQLVSLQILKFVAADAGEYQCRVTNEVGSSTCSARVTLREPPSFVKKIEPTSSLRGGTAAFQATLKGSLPITVTWLKDNDEITEDDNIRMTFENNVASLYLSGIEVKHDGKYVCQAKNDAGIQRCSALLSVKEPPYFVEKPQSQDVNPSSRVQLKALVGGTAPMTIKWFKDNKELHPGAARSVWKDDTSTILELFSAKAADSGTYICQLSNDVGTTSSKATLFVKEPPQFIKKPSPVLVLRNGQSTTFECQVTGTPEIRVSWYLDGNEITDLRKYGISFVDGLATFQISNARVENSGTYVCEARNDAGTASCSIELKVKEPPIFIRELEPVEVVKDSDVELECEVMGTTPFDVTWLKNNKEIRSGKKYTMSEKMSVFYLHITKCDPSDAGDYQCIIANEGGSCSCSARVALKAPPSFIKKIENVTTVLKSSATFQSTVAGSPPISITWLKDDQILEESDNVHVSFVDNVATLQVRSVDNGHSGRYTCQAKNESGVESNLELEDTANYTCKVSNVAGDNACSGILTVKEPPKFVKKLEATKIVKAGDSTRLECKITGSPEIQVVWYRNEHELTASDKYQMTFIDSVAVLQMNSLGTEDSGDFICEAQNPAGSTSCSTKVVVK
ncbi:hypothetical protein A6R68_22542, partial [Neotoma lepida]